MPFLLDSMEIEKVEMLVANLYDKTEYVIHIRNLKQALNHRLVLKKVLILITKCLAKTIYWYEHRSKKKKEKTISKIFFLIWWISFVKNYRKCYKTQRY